MFSTTDTLPKVWVQRKTRMGCLVGLVYRSPLRVRCVTILCQSPSIYHVSRLRRVYILINAPHGITTSDEQVLETLQQKCSNREVRTPISFQAVLTKIDLLPSKGGREQIDDISQRLLNIAPSCLPPLLTSSKTPQMGIEQLRASIVQAARFG